MATQKRLFEIFEYVTGEQPELTDQEIGDSVWTESVISEFLESIGQTDCHMMSLTAGVSKGKWRRVKFSVKGDILYLQFQTPEEAHIAINNFEQSDSTQYEFSSRFKDMPNVIMVKIGGSVSEGDLEYMHMTTNDPNNDLSQIGTEVVPDTLPEGVDPQTKLPIPPHTDTPQTGGF